MPSTLDINRASHGKSFISPPRINLRKAAAYNYDKGPLSATSSRFNFNHLVFSPPPSPGLPSLSPPTKKPARRGFISIRPIRVIRYTIRLLSIVVVFFVALDVLTRLFGEPVPSPAPGELSGSVVRGNGGASSRAVTDSPMPIIVSDHRGRAKWTVSIPSGSEFPLTMHRYAEMCTWCELVARKVQDLRSQGRGLHQFSLGFGSDTTNGFVDVQEAQEAGYLPKVKGGESSSDRPVCKKSLIFVLESDDAGLGRTLMMLWIAYGLAEEEGRAFFVDDTRWAYGSYTNMFLPPALSDCVPPPTHEILPCPRQARHLVVSAANAAVWLAPLTPSRDTAPAADATRERTLLKHQFDLARKGYEALFRLTKEDADYVDSRARELTAKRLVLARPSSSSSSSSKKAKNHDKKQQYHHGLAVGVHIRRGDRHPLEPQYRDSYIPLHLYADAAREVLDARFGNATVSTDKDTNPDSSDAAKARERSILILASDDPTVYSSPELVTGSSSSNGGGDSGVTAVRAQERIRLASRPPSPANTPAPNRSVLRKFVDQSFGWEGGFFAAMFWNLGAVTQNAGESTAPRPSGSNSNRGGRTGREASSSLTPPPRSPETLRLRSLVGRAYVLDLAVLAEASDVVVCAVSAMGCRLLAVMMGWQSAFEEGGWKNVEGGFGWLGAEW
jgi:hypothetical protein